MGEFEVFDVRVVHFFKVLDFFIEFEDLFFIHELLIDDFGDFKFDIFVLKLIIAIIKGVQVLFAHLIK